MADGTDYGKIIVLTGAGASVPLGLCTMKSFLNATQLGATGCPSVTGMPAGVGAAPEEALALDRLLLKMGFRHDIWDLESVYDRIQSYTEFCAECAVDRNLQDLILNPFFPWGGRCRLRQLLATAKAAQRHLNRMILAHFGSVDAELAYNVYGDLVRWLRQRNGAPVTLFTTNYDMTFECLQESGRRRHLWQDSAIITGLRPHDAGFCMVWDPAVYESVTDATQLVVYRLHGCSHWFFKEDGQIVALPHSVADSVDLTPMVIFPSRLKTDLLHGGPFSQAYRALRRAVAQAEVCLVIGHSFRDIGIREAIASAPASTKFVVVDPGLTPEDIQRALEGHEFRPISQPFGERDTGGAIRDAVETFLRTRSATATGT